MTARLSDFLICLLETNADTSQDLVFPFLIKRRINGALHSSTHDVPATLDHWQQHLDHKFILSIVPLLDNGTCGFACVDADEYEIDYSEICERIDRLKLPFIAVAARARLAPFVFFEEPVPAKLIVPVLEYWAARLGLKKFEIFPTNDGSRETFHGQWRCPMAGHGMRWLSRMLSTGSATPCCWMLSSLRSSLSLQMNYRRYRRNHSSNSRYGKSRCTCKERSILLGRTVRYQLLSEPLLYLVSLGFDAFNRTRSGVKGPLLDTTR